MFDVECWELLLHETPLPKPRLTLPFARRKNSPMQILLSHLAAGLSSARSARLRPRAALTRSVPSVAALCLLLLAAAAHAAAPMTIITINAGPVDRIQSVVSCPLPSPVRADWSPRVRTL